MSYKSNSNYDNEEENVPILSSSDGDYATTTRRSVVAADNDDVASVSRKSKLPSAKDSGTTAKGGGSRVGNGNDEDNNKNSKSESSSNLTRYLLIGGSVAVVGTTLFVCRKQIFGGGSDTGSRSTNKVEIVLVQVQSAQEQVPTGLKLSRKLKPKEIDNMRRSCERLTQILNEEEGNSG